LTAINRSAKGEKKVPLFLTNAKESPDIDTIKLYFAQQGIPDIAFPLFCSDSEFNTQSIDGCYFVILPPKPTDMAIILREIVANKEITIITFREPISDLTTIEDIARMIKGLKRPDELDFDFEEANTHYIDREEFETERSLWRKRALLYQDFLRLSKTVQQKEYYDIIDWYHKEYEILPTWYKRFGHIIKVIMGKRSLGSLFSNKKKYNN